jgi:Holliday junction resolvase RusA-like endonuclease
MTPAMFKFTVPGKPIGKARPRFTNAGRTFTPKETVLAEQAIRIGWQDAGATRLPDGPVCLEILLGVSRPRGHYKRDGTLTAEGQRTPFPYRQKPDLDNAVKLIMDALNGVAYTDDVQVVDVLVRRLWASEPYTEVQAWTMSLDLADLEQVA